MTHHKIFISKGTLDYSRGRSIRQLDAELDSQGKNDVGTLSNPLSGATKQIYTKATPFERSAVGIADTHPVTLGDNSEVSTSFLPQEFYDLGCG